MEVAFYYLKNAWAFHYQWVATCVPKLTAVHQIYDILQNIIFLGMHFWDAIIFIYADVCVKYMCRIIIVRVNAMAAKYLSLVSITNGFCYTPK